MQMAGGEGATVGEGGHQTPVMLRALLQSAITPPGVLLAAYYGSHAAHLWPDANGRAQALEMKVLQRAYIRTSITGTTSVRNFRL